MQDATLKGAVEALMRRDVPATEQKTEAKPVETKTDIVETEPKEVVNEQAESENIEEVAEVTEPEEIEEDRPIFEVEFAGEKKQVDADELIKGYKEFLKNGKRQSDYTAKFQAVAEKERTLTAQAQQVAQEAAVVNQYRDNLVILNQVLETPPVDPRSLDQMLAEGDTEGYLKANRQLEEWKGKKTAIQQELIKVSQYQQQKNAYEIAQRQAQERAILQDKFPDLIKEDNSKKLLGYLNTAYGYSYDELGTIADHRSFIIAEKARKYDELMNRAKEVKKNPNVPKVIKKGSPKVEYAQSEDYKKARMSLAKTGSDADAVKALLLKQTKR
jgi:hypothetical protein